MAASTSRAVGAFVRGVARTMPRLALRDHGGASLGKIDYERAVEDHEVYVKALERALGGSDRVVRIDADDDQADCVFIEDAAIFAGGKLLLTRPGAVSRQGEIVGLRDTMMNSETMMKEISQVADMQVDAAENATVDGGDVMCTGRHMLVGLSDRTNAAGAAFLEDYFGSVVDVVVVPPPKLEGATLHLKCALTHIDAFNAVVASTPGALATCQAVNAAIKTSSSPDPYSFHSVGSEDIFANVVRVNETLIVPESPSPKAQECYSHILAADTGIEEIVQVPWREFAKADGSLTCRSVIIRE